MNERFNPDYGPVTWGSTPSGLGPRESIDHTTAEQKKMYRIRTLLEKLQPEKVWPWQQPYTPQDEDPSGE